MKRGEIPWANLCSYRPQEPTGRRSVIVSQSDELSRVLQSVLVAPLTTSLNRARLAGAAMIAPAPDGPPDELVVLHEALGRIEAE